MNITIRLLKPEESHLWDQYVMSHPDSTLYHLSGWKNVIEKTYGHKAYYLMAVNKSKYDHSLLSNTTDTRNTNNTTNHRVVGILPLVHLKHWLFGNSLISIPYFDLGGILAEDKETEVALFSEALKLGYELKVKNIELRHTKPLSWIDQGQFYDATNNLQQTTHNCVFQTRSHKVRMLLDLPESPDILMKSFKAKLRSQVMKPIKEGLTAKIGGLELLNDFYKVFSENMRDLGSPVHDRKLIKNVISQFQEDARIIIVYNSNQPIACSMVIAFKDTLENPWASALRKLSRLSPNMLLYWTMLEYACNIGLSQFDFGRSSPDEGTFKFKEQWGAKPTILHWHYCFLGGKPIAGDTSEKSRFNKAIRYWQMLPVPVTKIIGPPIRKHIGL